MSKKNHILGDHKKVKSTFITPWNQALGSTGLISWKKDFLPELLWIRMLQDKLGYRKANEFLIAFHKQGIKYSSNVNLQCTHSNFGMHDESSQKLFKEAVSSLEHFEDFRNILMHLDFFYPNHPMSFLFSDFTTMKKANLDEIRVALRPMFDRRAFEPMMAQALVVLCAIVNGTMKLPSNSGLSNFEAIENYPKTEESRRVGSLIRATINLLKRPDLISDSNAWHEYFWQRSLDLSPPSIKFPNE